MTERELRKLQNQFLEALDASGFFRRVRDGDSVPLFDKDSPTALQVRQRLYPAYRKQFQEYLEKYGGRGSCSRQSVPAYFRHHGNPSDDSERSETAPEKQSVLPVSQGDSRGEAQSEMPRVSQRLLRKG
jgi:hypothetical protein